MWERVKAWWNAEDYNITSEELVARANQRSHKALSTFTDAVDELQKANHELAVAIDCDEKLIKEMEQNIETAEDQYRINQEAIGRIKNVIGGTHGN